MGKKALVFFEKTKRSEEIYQTILSVLIEQNYDLVNYDSLITNNEPLSIQMLDKIKQSDIILAEISNLSPWVLFQLGIAVGNGKKIIALSQEVNNNFPLELFGQQLLTYDKTKNSLKYLGFKLTENIKNIQSEIKRPPIPAENLHVRTNDSQGALHELLGIDDIKKRQRLFEDWVKDTISKLTDWDVISSSVQSDRYFDFVVWLTNPGNDLSLLGNPVPIEIKANTNRLTLNTVKKIHENIQKQMLKSVAVFTLSEVNNNLKNLVHQIYTETNVIVMLIGLEELRSVKNSGDFYSMFKLQYLRTVLGSGGYDNV